MRKAHTPQQLSQKRVFRIKTNEHNGVLSINQNSIGEANQPLLTANLSRGTFHFRKLYRYIYHTVSLLGSIIGFNGDSITKGRGALKAVPLEGSSPLAPTSK